jgi:hypothetical protein
MATIWRSVYVYSQRGGHRPNMPPDRFLGQFLDDVEASTSFVLSCPFVLLGFNTSLVILPCFAHLDALCLRESRPGGPPRIRIFKTVCRRIARQSNFLNCSIWV